MELNLLKKQTKTKHLLSDFLADYLKRRARIYGALVLKFRKRFVCYKQLIWCILQKEF